MDPTNLHHPKKLPNANKTFRSNQLAYTQTDSKQTANTVNSNDRKIKQIVPLDSKKIKTLGIEQTILSALTKFNGKDRSKPSKSVQQPAKQASSSSLPASLSSLLVNRSNTESPVPIHISSSVTTIASTRASVPSLASRKSPETPSTKKIHVLSNVLLNEHKLSLKDFTAIASSTPVRSTNVSYVPQVPNPIKCETVKFENDDTFLSNTSEEPTELITADNIDETIVEIETHVEDEDFKEIEIAEEQMENTAVRLIQKQSSEIDSLKGFSSNDLKRSQNKCDYLQNEIHLHPTMSSSRSENETQVYTTEADELGESLSNSDNELDLEELRREAQRIIELNDLESEPVAAADRKSKSVENDSIDSSAEHIDKDQLIDEFLDSTISSFHIPFASNTTHSNDSSSDSGSEHDANFDTLNHTEYNDYDEDEPDYQMIEITEIDVVKEEHIDEPLHYHEPSTSKSQKRKINDRSENNFGKTKRKKTDTMIDTDEISSDAMVQSQEPQQAPHEQLQSPAEIHQVIDEPINNNQHIKPTAKRGRKAKQTVLNEYFVVQNEAGTSKSMDSSLNDSSSMASDAPVKSSRYGRVIKPKSYDLEAPAKVKLERKSSKDAMDSTNPAHAFPIPNPPTHAVIQPPKKRDRQKIASESFNTCEEESITLSSDAGADYSDTLKILSAQRISAQQLLAEHMTPALDHTQSTSIEQVSIDDRTNEKICSSKKTGSLGRRGRPPKNSKSTKENQQQNEAYAEQQPSNEYSIADMSDSTEPTSVAPKRRGRPSKNVAAEISPTLDTTSVLTPSNNTPAAMPVEETTVTTPHRPRIKVKNPELLFPQVEQTPDSSVALPKKRGRKRIKPLEPEDENTPKYKCGNCQQEIPVKRWKAHEFLHTGVTYRAGIDEPIDVDDAATQTRIMTRFMKHHKIQYLKCPKCGCKKRSALGYISHVEMCGLTEAEAKAMKAECEFCKKLYRKVSLASHQQSFCTVRRLEMAQQIADEEIKTACETEADEQREEVIYTESGRPKRQIKKVKRPTSRAAEEFIKVGSKITGGTMKCWANKLHEENSIQCPNDNCTFQTDNLDEMRMHYKRCKESLLHCRICSKTEHSRDKIVEHIESEHADVLKMPESDEDADNPDDDDFKETNETSTESSDGESDFKGDEDFDEMDDLSGVRGKPAYRKFKPSRQKRTIPLKRIMEEDSPALWEMVSVFYTQILSSRPGYYRKANQWTKEFVEQNYDLNELAFRSFARTDIDFVRLPQRELNKFLSLLNLKSPLFSCQNVKQYRQEKFEPIDGNWNQLNFLESEVNQQTKTTSAVLFCGGKIVTADWIPFPKDYSGSQVLAVYAQSKGSKPVSLTNCIPPEKCKTLIQLWSVSASQDNATIDSTEFKYGIAYDDGPICTMAFCPSDAYIASKRLAIVALPDTNGNVNIISLPDNIPKAKNKAPTIIKVKVDIKLRLGFNSIDSENGPQTITQLTWSRVKGHKVICAGYNTGLVAIWNFNHLNFPHMCRRSTPDDAPTLVPQFTFLGALSFITQLDLHSDNEDNVRWVLVGALDRRVRLYDLHDPHLVPYSSQVFKSRNLTGTWPMHWPIYLTMIDAALTQMNGGLHIKSVLYTDNQPRNINLCIDCEPSNLAFSDWLNTGMFGTDAGDLIMINFHQLLLHDRFDESAQQKVVSSTDVFHEERLITSEESGSDEQYRVLFNDFDETVIAPKADYRIVPIDQHPHARITRTAINPNESHQKLYAIGYELGFCRIHFLP